MESIYRLYLEVTNVEEESFVASHREIYLVKRPKESASKVEVHGSFDDEEEDLPTQLVGLKDTDSKALADPSSAALEWQIEPVRKLPGYPPFNRVVVGRSRICDVVVPFPSISRVHCHFHMEQHVPKFLSDQRAANGTFLNGTQLAPLEPVPVAPGDTIRLGTVELALLDARGLHRFLRAL